MINFFAIYNPITFNIIGVYPEHAAADIEHKILISTELATSIFDGIVPISNLFVDLTTNIPTITQQQIINKIDDILHRIPNKQFIQLHTDADVTVLYNVKLQTIVISISNNIKTIKWGSETNLKFIISSYNDPHNIYQIIEVKLSELIHNPISIQYNGPSKFSVFTSRIFKNYIFEQT